MTFAPAVVDGWSFDHKPTPKQLKTLERHKTRFPNDEATLCAHLSLLSLDVLAPYLVWIPPEELDERQPVGHGEFAVVERATIKVGENKIEVAIKNMKFDLTNDLRNELLYNIHVCFNGSAHCTPTPLLFGLSMTKEQKYSLVMQYAAGGTLEHVLRHNPPQNWQRVWQIAMEITRRLHVIHEAGMVHCDLHPGNIVFDLSGDDSIPLIIDLGASKPLSQFRVNLTIGRLEYLPPEFFRAGPATQRYDIYDLGLILWQLTSRFPPRGSSITSCGDITDPFKGLREEPVPGTPECYCKLYRDCWRSDPFSRPTTADVLRRLMDNESEMMAAPWLDTIPEAIEHLTRREKEFLTISSSFEFVSATESEIVSASESDSITDVEGKHVSTKHRATAQGTFPEEWFFIKSQNSGFFLGLERGSETAGGKLTIDEMRPKDHASQLWKFRHDLLINKKSGLALDLEHGSISSGTHAIHQTVRNAAESASQQWGLTIEGYIHTKNSNTLVLGTRESWFGKGEGDHVYLLDKKDVEHKEQRWNFVVPMPKDPSESVTLISRQAQFPEGWFFIKNQSSNLVLDVKNGALKAGENIITTTLKKKDYESQLWQFRDGQLVNKKSGLAIHVKAGNFKVLTEVIQYTIKSKDNTNQLFGLTPESRIFVKSKPNLVLGFKGGIFGRREGAHVNLQIQDKKDKKEQRWDFVAPVFKKKEGEEVKVAADAVSTKSVSTKHLATAQGTFPEEWFFIKSQNSGFFLGVEGGSEAAGGKLTTDAMRPKDYASQLWKFRDGFLINKKSGLALDLEHGSISNGTHAIHQTVRNAAESASQQWDLTIEGYIHTKNSNTLVLGTKESWFGKGEGDHVYLLDKKDVEHKEQRWNFVVPMPKDPSESVMLISRQAQFPEGWFFIKNHSSNLVLDVENGALKAGENIITTTLKKKDYESQLWQSRDGQLVNKKSGLAIHVKAENLKLLTEVIQYTIKSKDNTNQLFGLTPEGHIFVKSEPNLVLGFKDEIFGRHEGAHVNLQIQDKKNKEQRWNFVVPVFKKKEGEEVKGTFPEEWFFIKSQNSGFFLGVEGGSEAASGKLTTDAMRPKDYASQLWKFRDGFLINKKSGLALDLEHGSISNGTHAIHQTVRNAAESASQQWGLTIEGYIHIKNSNTLVLSTKESWFGKGEGDHVYLLDKKDVEHKEQRWNFVVPIIKLKETSVSAHILFRCVLGEELVEMSIYLSHADRRFNSKEFAVTVEDQGTKGAIDIAVVAAAQSDRRALITGDTNYFFSIPNAYGTVVLWGKAEGNRMFKWLKPREKADAVSVLFKDHMQELERIYSTSDRVLAFWSEGKDKSGITRTTWELRQPKEAEMVLFVQKYMREQQHYKDSTLNQ